MIKKFVQTFFFFKAKDHPCGHSFSAGVGGVGPAHNFYSIHFGPEWVKFWVWVGKNADQRGGVSVWVRKLLGSTLIKAGYFFLKLKKEKKRREEKRKEIKRKKERKKEKALPIFLYNFYYLWEKAVELFLCGISTLPNPAQVKLC